MTLQSPFAFPKEENPLKYIWLFLSLILLTFLLIYNWHRNLVLTKNDLQDIAQESQDNMEKLLNQFMQVVFDLPVYGKHFANCHTDLLPILQKAVAENPLLTGLSISDNSNQTVCSTLPFTHTISSRSKQIVGPVIQNGESFFILQERLGDYHISMYMAEKVLENVMKKTVFYENNSVFLYNSLENKIILSTNKTLPDIQEIQKLPHSVIPLLSINDLQLITSITKEKMLEKQIISSIIISLIFTLFSTLLYLVIKSFFNRYHSIHGHLRYALKHKQFFPMFQPVFDAKNNRFSSMEVLMRWKTADDDIIMPEVFIQEAEKTGLIVPITLQVADLAMQSYKQIVPSDKPFYMAFNVSAHHFTHETFFMDFIGLVAKHGLKPEQILLELTERDLLDKNDKIFSKKMELLRKMNFSLAIDDFGTGHANISYLQHFPFNYLKIDKLFIQSIGTGSVTESLIDTMVSMAKSLNLIIIAEGIEVQSQVDYLLNNEVQYMQGWYYAKAMSAEELQHIFKDN